MIVAYSMYITGTDTPIANLRSVVAARREEAEREMRDALKALRVQHPKARLVILPVKDDPKS
jgi:repressor of nif and glnA expression